MLSLLVVVSLVVSAVHSYSHQLADIANCHMCVHHGDSNDAIISNDATFSLIAEFAAFEPGFLPVTPLISPFYRPPGRAPPQAI